MPNPITLACIAFGLLIAGLGPSTPVTAQPLRSSARIGVVRNLPPTDPMHQAFVRGLRERGWVEGRNLTVHSLQGEVTLLPRADQIVE